MLHDRVVDEKVPAREIIVSEKKSDIMWGGLFTRKVQYSKSHCPRMWDGKDVTSLPLSKYNQHRDCRNCFQFSASLQNTLSATRDKARLSCLPSSQWPLCSSTVLSSDSDILLESEDDPVVENWRHPVLERKMTFQLRVLLYVVLL